MRLELERVVKERELLKRDNEVIEHKKKLDSELQTTKQKMERSEVCMMNNGK